MSGFNLIISEKSLTFRDILNYMKQPGTVEISPQSLQKIETSRGIIQKILNSKKAVYGVNTGFGKFAEVRISSDQVAELQKRFGS